MPGIGKILSRVLRYDIHDIARFPTVPDFVSSCRLGTCAKESAGTRLGTSGKNIGNVHLQGALSEAAAWFRRNNPAGPQDLARWEKKHGQGEALTLLAHQLARGVYDRLKRHTAFAMEQCRHG